MNTQINNAKTFIDPAQLAQQALKLQPHPQAQMQLQPQPQPQQPPQPEPQPQQQPQTNQASPVKLFDSQEECARDFAEKAMPLTDHNNKEYSAVMTTVQVPDYVNGQWTTKPKYKYGDIVEGEHNNVVKHAVAGLMDQTDGEKYLLHTHPNNIYTDPQDPNKIITYDEPDYFSGYPLDLKEINDTIPPETKPLGDASIPTLAGSQWYELPQILNNLPQIVAAGGNPLLSAALQFIKDASGKSLTGYDGIYLAAPTGKLYLYKGYGNDKYYADTFTDLRDKENKTYVTNGFPQSKVQWDYTTNTYKPGYWNKDDKFILTP